MVTVMEGGLFFVVVGGGGGGDDVVAVARAEVEGGDFRLAEDAERGGAKKEARVVCPVEDFGGLPLILD
jgi:hypothetical protein